MLGRKVERRNAPGDVWSFAYDSRDNMVLTTDAKNQTIEKTYDAMSRMTRMIMIRADGTTVDDQTQAYDAMGRKTQAYDSDSDLAWSYGVANRVARTSPGGKPYSIKSASPWVGARRRHETWKTGWN